MRRPIPPDHLLPPWALGRLRWATRTLPLDWDEEHTRCEEQTLQLDSMPVADLYVDGPHLNEAMGWCVDA